MQRPGRPLLLLLAVWVSLIPLTCQDTRQKRQILSDQPRLLTENGNLIFQSGTSHNITFRSGANSGIYMNTFELSSVVQMVTANSNNISRLANQITSRERRINAIRRNFTDKTDALNSTLRQVRETLRTLSESETEARSQNANQIADLTQRLSALESTVHTIQRLLSDNECASSTQCQNGGSCIDLYNGYYCICPSNWRGSQCEIDVNECLLYIGTGDGCKNGGTCINTPGSYRCQCTNDWYGIDCNVQHNDCQGSDSWSMCGQGRCVNLPRTQPGQLSYTCTCHPGYTLSTTSGLPRCVDIDECTPTSGYRYPCSTVPHVSCQNLPGSFFCGQCPQGYTGNGSYCALSDRCLFNNGGCHPNAVCRAPDGYSITCDCGYGYVGNGFGPNGCIPQSSSAACSSSPCLNGGICIPHGLNTFVCSCPTGYTGTTCNTIVSPCSSNPCQNSGTCMVQNSSFICNCASSYTGFNCEQIQQECGSLVGEVGRYEYPAEGNYNHNLNCLHVIRTVPGKILKMNFIDFHLELEDDCEYDYLEVFDGPSAQSYSFGRFCGTSLRGRIFRSSQNQMLLKFISDENINNEGFTVTWTSEVPVCGGTLSGQMHGVISSPNYPQTFPPSTSCLWIIAVTPGKYIELQLSQVVLDCSNAFIDIRNGEDEGSPLLRKVCGSNVPSSVVTSGPSTFIRFVSNYTTAHQGFSISYAETGQACGGVLSGVGSNYVGEFTSPQRLNAEPQNCVWSIIVPENNYISLRFTSFQQSCGTSRLTVFDGRNFVAPVLSHLCGQSIPNAVNSTGNAMYIEWRATSTLLDDNFFAHWTGVCGGKFVGENGVFSTPTTYTTSLCSYEIEVPAGKTILLSFTNVTSHYEENCDFQVMSVYDGDSVSARVIRAVNCSDTFPTYLRSIGNKMLIRFEARNGFGFTANFTAQENLAGCGGVLYGTTGSFETPGFPNNYERLINCTWYINVNEGYLIKLTFHTFNLENHLLCIYDFVELYDSGTISSEHKIGRYCGSNRPPEVTSSGNAMVIYMKADDYYHFTGFQASYVALHESLICGRNLFEPTGVITSPNYPNSYPNYKNCEWTITVAAGNQIVLNISDFTLEPHPNCQYDYLEIRNGGFSNSPFIAKLCGYHNQIEPITSHSNKLYLKFVTDVSHTEKGFYLNYHQEASSCGGQLSASTESFHSPNYPELSTINVDCEWRIHVSEGSKITLSFESLFYIVCSNSLPSLEVHYGYRKKKQLCGTQTPSPTTFDDNNLVVKYKQGYYSEHMRFRAIYHVDCNNVLNGTQGVIESPNFPNPYQGSAQCSWTIKVPTGNRINAHFAVFSLQPDTTCRQDYVQITGSNLTNTKLCGDSVPPNFQSTLNEMNIQFKSDSYLSYQGFRLEWTIEGCGAIFRQNSGGFTSPNYPRTYNINQTCIWEIIVDEGLVVQLNILDFDVESHSNCNFDVLEVYSRGVTHEEPIVRICHKQTSPQTVTSDGNHMLVMFKSDISESFKGFNATFNAIQRVCGADLTTRTGTISSPNRPSNGWFSFCRWNITVEAGHIVNLTLTDLSIDCEHEHLSISSYPNEMSDDEDYVQCGSNTTVFLSRSNQMYISLLTSWWYNNNHGGFRATYKTGCGGTRNADESGEITSPFFPHNYGRNSDCVWIITSSSEAVYLTFVHMDIPDSLQQQTCQYEYVSVINEDGNSTYCGLNMPHTIYSQTSTLQVHFHSTYSAASGFRAKYSSLLTSCGGDLVSIRGRFASPHYPLDYPDDTECVWQIRASAGNTIEINFLEFLLIGNRSNDYVEIHTPDVNGRTIDRWYGNNIPGNLTGLQGAWILFRSDEHTHSQGFLAEYTHSCGGEFTDYSGQISSLGYPSNYLPNSNCRWTITLPYSYVKVKITFSAIHLESGYQGLCPHDYIQFYDGNEETGTEIGRYCGSNIPSTITSTTNQVTIKFVSDSYHQSSGFLLTWTHTFGRFPSIATSAANCNGTYTANSSQQVMTSPGYPANYADNLDCYRTIIAPEGSKVSVRILNLRVEACLDYILFFDGDDFTNSQRIRRVCQYSGGVGTVITSRTNILGLLFHSDYSFTYSGFELTYQQVCGSYITDVSSGIITSANYPTNYPANETCTWQVLARPGKTIGLTFSQPFDVEDYESCQHDFLKLLNGGSSSSPPLIANGSSNTNGTYCGSVAPPNLNTSSNQLFVQFVSDDSGSGHGFSFTFTELSIACGGTLTLNSFVREGNFTSPNYPGNYDHNVDCIWKIIAPPFQRIRVDFVDRFFIEHHDGCLFDYVEFRDGGTAIAPIIGEPFCGSNLPSTIYSSSNFLFVRFRTDDSDTHEGFKAKYSIATCGGRIVGNNGTITSPNNPSNCEWDIFGTTGHYIRFTFETQHIPQAQNCVNYVEIRDGNATDSIIFSSCTDYFMSVETSDSRAYVKFISDQHGQGFRLMFQSSLEACGGNLHGSTGVIMSPNFPGLYAHNRTCVWNIEVDTESSITLTFTDFNLENHTNCIFDHVQVFNGIEPDSPSLGKFCGLVIPQIQQSTGNTMKIKFHTDTTITSGGFRATYSSDNPLVCGGEISESTGFIASPQSNNSHNIQCIWKVSTNTNNVRLSFLEFDLESHMNCMWDFLEIREGADRTGSLVGRFCGRTKPHDDIVIRYGDVWLMYRTDATEPSVGFNISFTASVCGGALYEHDQLSSPHDPPGSNFPISCFWMTYIEEGYAVKVTPVRFNLSCTDGFLSIQNGFLPDSPVVGRYCNSSVPTTFTSPSNQLRLTSIIYRPITEETGFLFDITPEFLACGGALHAVNGTLKSPNYPRSYPHDTECRWEINVNQNYYVKLQFNLPFDMAAHDTCEHDYVQVLDISNDGTEVSLGKWCSNQRPTDLYSSSNKMVVVFRSDHTTNGLGFSASWTSHCGGTYTAESGEITSPNYPRNYPFNTECTYTIRQGRQKLIKMKFTDLQLAGQRGSSPYYGCYSGDRVEVRIRNLYGQSVCRYVANQVFQSQEFLQLVFTSRSRTTDRGFSAQYESIDCGGNFTNASGVISTHGFHENFTSPSECFWNITVEPDKIIRLKITDLRLSRNTNCRGSVQIFEGPNGTSPLIGTFCKLENAPDVIRSSSNHLYLKYSVNYDYWYSQALTHSLKANYWTTYGPLAGCGGILNQVQGTFSAPDVDHNGQYEPNLDCWWYITLGLDKTISLNITNINIDGQAPCESDYLLLYDGLDDIELGKYCGTLQPVSLSTSHNILRVVFVSDSDRQGSGFTITYAERERPCGGFLNVTDDTQMISFPDNLISNNQPILCNWVIDTQTTDITVQLNISDRNCSNGANLFALDVPMIDAGQKIDLCDPSIHDPFYSLFRQMRLYFNGTTSSRFQLNYTIADCDRAYSQPSGRIMSPGFPFNYRHLHRCFYRIRTAEDTSISIYFRKFSLEYHQNCQWDYLKISSTNFDSTYCGSTIPSPLFINNSRVTIEFKTDYSVFSGGFDIIYISSTQGPGCGGNITGQNYGIFTSPGFPNNSPVVQTCTWLISPHGTLYFHYVQQSPSLACDTDYVAVYRGTSETDPLISRYCNEVNDISPVQFSSTVMVQFVSSGNNSAPVFKFSWAPTVQKLLI